MKKMILLLVLVTVAMACQKEELPDNPENPPVPEKNYYPLTIGSYWNYQSFEVDTNGIATALSYTDSVKITKDTIININTYKVFEGTNKPFMDWGILDIVRDSSGYIVNIRGTIIFSPDNFADTLQQGVFYKTTNNDTLYTYFSMMEDNGQVVNLPAGAFEVLNYKTTYIFPDYISNPLLYRRDNNTFYAPNVGKVVSAWFYASKTDVIEKRLTSYYIAP
jgi:hypothetical protein